MQSEKRSKDYFYYYAPTHPERTKARAMQYPATKASSKNTVPRRAVKTNRLTTQRRQQAATTPHKTPKTFVYAGALVVIIAAITGIRHFTHAEPSTAHVEAAKTTTQAVASAKPAVTIPKPAPNGTTDEQMATTIRAVIAANPDVDMSITITDLSSLGTTVRFGTSPSVSYEAASVAKLITATCFLDSVQQGKQSLNDSIDGTPAKQLLQAMIEQSDNDAWKSLNDALTHDTLQTYATTVGLGHYDADSNLLTSDDVAMLLAKLYKQQLLNQANTDLLLSYMKNANRTDFIRAAIPNTVAFYHKAGWLEDRDHDAAIIDDGNHPYTLVIFTNGHGNYHATDRSTLIQQIASASVAHFIGQENQ